MAKKNEVTIESQEVSIPSTLRPAAVVGVNTSKISLNEDQLPEEFKGATLEIIETGFAPTVKWNAPGDYVAGVFVSMEEGVGPNKACLYTLDAKGKQFGVWGTTVLDRAMRQAIATGQIKPGYLMMMTYITAMPSDYEANPTKLFHIQIAKKK